MDGAIVQVGDDGSVVYRASALGMCTKALVAARLGYEALEIQGPRAEAMRERMDEGKLHEDAVVERMRREGWEVNHEQLIIELPITENVMVRGHIDGLGLTPYSSYTLDSRRRVVEIKTQSKDEFAAFSRHGWDSGFFPRYKWQLSAYMLATGLPAVVVRKDRNSGRLDFVYVDKPFYSLGEITARVLTIEALSRDYTLPEDCDRNDFPCSYSYLHTQKEEEGEKFVSEEVERLAREYREGKRLEEQGKQRKDDARNRLLKLCEGGRRGSSVSGVRVSFREVEAGPRRLSAAAEEGLRAGVMWYLGVDIDEYKTRGKGPRINLYVPEEVAEKWRTG